MGELANAFLDAAPQAPEGVDRDSLEEELASALRAAREAWPGVEASDVDVVRYVAERITADDPVGALGKLCFEDLFVAAACSREDPGALAAFERAHLSGVPEAVRRIDASQDFVDEVVQVTRVGLLLPRDRRPPRLANYRGAGKLRSWVQVCAVRTALELRRKARPQDVRTDDELMDSPGWEEDPELGHIRQLYRSEFATAFEEAMGTLESRERNLLRMQLLDGLNIDQMGAIYRVHRATVARWIARARDRLRDETQRRLVLKLRISDTQLQSLMAVVRSHIDLSIERFLAPPDEG